MDLASYEQFTVQAPIIGDMNVFLKEGETYQVVIYNGEPLDVKFPYKMVLVVTKAEDGVRGDTVSGATKAVTLETGFVCQVPSSSRKARRSGSTPKPGNTWNG
jgi:elongation factor P